MASGDASDDDLDDTLASDLDEVDQVERWAAEARVADAVAERRRAAWLIRQAESETSMAGVLGALAERDRPVVIHLLDGRQHRGTIVAVGRDVVDLCPMTGGRVLLSLAAVAAVHTPGAGPDAGAPPRSARTDLARELGELAAERARVLVVTRTGSDATTGTLVAVGRDLLTLQGPSGGWIYVPLDALAEVSLPESG